MKPHQPNPDLLTRWIDGELDDAAQTEFSAFWEAADPSTRAAMEAEKTAAHSLGGLLRDHFPARHDVAGPELFMHQLAHRLDREDEISLPEPQVQTGDVGTPSPARFRFHPAPWLAAAAAVALGIFALQSFRPPSGQSGMAANGGNPVPASDALLASYAPDANIRMDATYNAEVDAVVIVLDGLKPVDSPEDLVGFHSDDPRPTEARLAGRVHPHRFRGGREGPDNS